MMSPQLAYWEPEDRSFWAREGAHTARRNLLIIHTANDSMSAGTEMNGQIRSST
jgi:hypothetical protein